MTPRLPLPALLLVTLGVAGCQVPTRERVSVDVEGVLQRTPTVQEPALTPPPRPPAPLAAASMVIPGLPARQPETVGESPEAIRAKLRRDAQEAREKVTAVLREVYAAEITALRFQNEREEAELRRTGLDAILSQIRTLFLELASKRAPLATRLAFLRGFPDPGPRAGILETEEAIRREAESVKLRAELAELDKAFDAEVEALKKGVEERVARRVEALATEVAARQRELDARAETEGRAQIQSLNQDLGLRLAFEKVPSLPATPPQTVRAPASAAIRPVTISDIANRATARTDLRQRLDTELKVWAGLRRVEVTAPAPNVRDATTDFERWRKLP